MQTYLLTVAGMLHINTVLSLLQLPDMLNVPGLGWGLAASHEQQPHLKVESLSSRKQHGCVRQLCFVNAQPRLCTPALDTSCAPYLCSRRCGSGKLPL